MLNTNQNLLFLSTLLALCIISFLHIFLFPLYNNEEKPANTKSFFDFEQTLCRANYHYKQKRIKQQQCLQYGIVTVYQGGRLGNQLWEYASVWALARKTGLEPYIPNCIQHRLLQVFESLSVPNLSEIGHCPMYKSTFVNSLDAWNYTNQSILLNKYIQLHELVLIWVQDIRQEFRFKRKLVAKSQQVLRWANPLGTNGTTYVGLHVRRTDYPNYLKRKHNQSSADVDFYFSAMRYFEEKYSNVKFIVVSDDPKWCKQAIGVKPNVYLSTKHTNLPGQDLAIMAACNHSIIDYGSYGVWGAILAGGETVVFNATHLSSSKVAHLLPNWKLLN